MKNKLKPLIKQAKKTAQAAIQQNLVNQLKEITLKFGEGSKKLDKKIAKEAKKLAKKFAKDIKVDKTLLGKTEAKPQITEAPKKQEAPKAETAKTKAATPVAKKPAATVAAS